MPSNDPRIDAYIEKKADFARPVLKHLRLLVHKACPGAEETIKWGMPYFDYKGNALCGMAAFKEHCTFLFWKAKLMQDPEKILQVEKRGAMGNFDRITSMKYRHSDKILIAYIKEAAKLNENDIKLPPRKKAAVAELKMPLDFAAALKKNKKAQAFFDGLSYGYKKDFVELVTTAKQEKTRLERIAKVVDHCAEGRKLNDKYKKVVSQ